jgi:hypothetical protein
MIDQNINHAVYLSFSQRGWTVISQGSPLCDYKASYQEVMRVVQLFRITLPDVTWNGDRSQWVKTQTISEINALERT